jgi:predicted SAM-dependent methyltransferase
VANQEVKLNLGSGKTNFGKDWINIDCQNFSHIKYHDICNLSQFKNNSVDLIYSSHVIEYFDRIEIVPVFTRMV